jgi:hypothetical protein
MFKVLFSIAALLIWRLRHVFRRSDGRQGMDTIQPPGVWDPILKKRGCRVELYRAAKPTLTTGGSGCAPCKGGVFQWVKVPPGKCSSRKLPEQLWR